MWPTYWRSAAWVGVGVFGQSLTLKPYFNLNHGNYRERWLRAGWLLKVLSREHALAQLCALSSNCSPGSLPVGLAIDILPDGAAGRVKLYFRSESTTLAWLARWHEGAGMAAAAPEVRRFLDLFGPVNTGMLPPGAMVVSLEIHADQRLSLKTDLAVTKWTAEDSPVFEAATAFLTSAGAAERLAVALISIGLGHGRRPEGALVRFVGLGFEPDGTSHLNLYLEPPHACPAPSATPRATRRSRPGFLRRGNRRAAAVKSSAPARDPRS